MQKKVLIYGLYDWCNLGDDLMMYAINEKLKNKGIMPFFIRNNNDNYFNFERDYDNELSSGSSITNHLMNKIICYFKVLKLFFKNDYDCLIFMGGGYINRAIGSGYGKLLYILLLKLAFSFKRKKIYFTGQSVGPLYNKIDSFLIKKIYSKSIVSVRENVSFQLLNDLKIKSTFVGDDAFLLDLPKTVFRKYEKKYIIVNFKDFSEYSSIKNSFLELLKKNYRKNGYKIVLVPFRKGTCYNEYLIHKSFENELKEQGIDVELFETASVDELLEIFARCEYVIATAYHAVVLGLMSNKKVFTGYIGEYYKMKIEGITSFYSPLSYNVYNMKNSSVFDYMLKECNKKYNVKNQNITNRLHENVNDYWDKIVRKIENEK